MKTKVEFGRATYFSWRPECFVLHGRDMADVLNTSRLFAVKWFGVFASITFWRY